MLFCRLGSNFSKECTTCILGVFRSPHCHIPKCCSLNYLIFSFSSFCCRQGAAAPCNCRPSYSSKCPYNFRPFPRSRHARYAPRRNPNTVSNITRHPNTGYHPFFRSTSPHPSVLHLQPPSIRNSLAR